jgi:subtilase family serine protease
MLETLLEAQQNARSPLYQKWLTPEEFGARFGVSEHDARVVADWLERNGMTVEPLPASRRWIMFSGMAGQVESAFHTEIHSFRVNGELHRANMTDPEVPQALAAVIGGVVSLHDFLAQPQMFFGGTVAPQFTNGTEHFTTPGDLSTIYDLRPLYNTGISGSGQSIAVVGRSNVALRDTQLFRSTYGLPANSPSVILNGADPGILSGNERVEANLDVQLAGAVAPNANIQLVVSKSGMTDGIVLSAEYIVEHNLAPVVSVSFGNCEAAVGSGGNQFWNALWQQAAAQGMTVLVASGDSGAAGCDNPVFGYSGGSASVNAICSTPYSTCVGGTQFADTSNPDLYWSAANGGSTAGAALGYIPETVWNESGATTGGAGLWAGGGGPSSFYPKPSWQTGPGVPAGNSRFVPDVSLNSAAHDGYRIFVDGSAYIASGTSASAPAFAGIMALAVQRRGVRLGNANPSLYTLAALQARGGSSVFHDVTTGNNSVPGLTGYSAGPGYDPATGLGSVDAAMLVNSWGAASTPVGSFQIATSSTVAMVQGQNAYAPVSVTPSGGFSSPVSLSAAGLPPGMTATFTPANVWSAGSSAPILILSSVSPVAPGTYQVTLNATGDGITQTLPISLTVMP